MKISNILAILALCWVNSVMGENAPKKLTELKPVCPDEYSKYETGSGHMKCVYADPKIEVKSLQETQIICKRFVVFSPALFQFPSPS